MPTYADICAQIADDLDDTTGEYADQIKRAVLAAIRYCERYTFYFNETRDITFTTVNGQEWYDATANPNIPTLVHIDQAWSEQPDGRRSDMTRVTPGDIEILADNSASSGQPDCWTYFGQRMRIYPIPDAVAYVIRLQVGPYRLAPLSAEGDTNAWLSEAFDMVKARAKYIVGKDTIKDPVVANEALGDFNDQFSALKDETTSRNATGCIQATSF